MRSTTRMAAAAGALALLAGAGIVSLSRPSAPPLPRPAATPTVQPDSSTPRGPSPVVVYVGEPCGYYCQKQLADLDGLGIRYQVRNIGTDDWALRQLRTHDRDLSVPTVVVGRRAWRGYDPTHARGVKHRLEYLERGNRLGTDGLVLFTGSTCPFSAKLRAELDALGVDYEDRVIDEDPLALAQLMQLTGETGVPVAVRGGDLWPGWSDERAEEIRASVEGG